MKQITCLIVLLLLAVPALGELHPTIQPVDKVSFNWPPPREIGAKDFFPIAKDGKAACAIVVPAEANRQQDMSAELLKLYLGIVTGGDFEIVREPAPVSGPAIYIGETTVGKEIPLELPPVRYGSQQFPNLHGFLVRTVSPRALVIRGFTDMGTSFGVVAFIRECLGVKRYWPLEPGGLGDVYDKKPTLSLPQLTWRDWPYYIARYVGYKPMGWEETHESEWPTLFKWNRMAFPLGMMHNLQVLIKPSEFGKEHPEYFPLINGKRYIPKLDGAVHWQPCISNPEVVEICAKKINAAFDRDPLMICHALAVNDGAGDCECEKCKAMDAPEADINTRFQLSDRYVKFMNAVAEKVAAKHPDRVLGFLVYGPLRDVPKTVKLHPNLLPFHCAMGEGVYPGWDKWMAAGAKNMGHYGYHDDMWFTIPKINPHQEARRVRYMVGSGVARGYWKEFNPHYPLDGQVASLVSDMMWDPRLDEDKVLTDYYQGMYGEAAPEMKAFFGILEKDYEDWLRAASPPHPYGPDSSDLDLDHSYEQFRVLTDAGVVKAWEQLQKARAKAVDSKAKARLELTESVFSFVVPSTREYWRLQWLPTAKNAAQAEKWAREALGFARQKAALKRDVIESPNVRALVKINREPYDQIKVGVIPQEVYEAIDRGFEVAYKIKPADPAWKGLAKDRDPVIAKAAEAVIARAKEETLPNLVSDAGFESGAKPEIIDREPKKGSIYVTPENPHGGKLCAVLYDCRDSSLVKTIPAKPGEKLWLSLWVRAKGLNIRTGEPTRCGVGFTAKKGTKALGGISAQVSLSEKWQQVRVPFTTPAQTDSVSAQVSVLRQQADARLWVDDVTITRAPVQPLKLDAAGDAGTGEVAPEE